MAPELSSNWQKLKAQLAQDSKAKEAKKRKAPTERQLNTLAKRRRLEGLPPLKPKGKGIGKMGSTASIETLEPAAAIPGASLSKWAEDNDISARDLADAYGESLQDIATAGSKTDVVNAGLCDGVEIGKYVGIDCEMVGVGGDEDRSVLARVSVVNFHGTQVYDSFVKPKEFVTDWRTKWSGVSAKNMATARTFEEVQAEVAKILHERIIVGHGIRNDLEVLLLSHPKKDIRDTSRFSGFRKFSAGKTPSLKKLTKEILGVCKDSSVQEPYADMRARLIFKRVSTLVLRMHELRCYYSGDTNLLSTLSTPKDFRSTHLDPRSNRRKPKRTRANVEIMM